MLPFFGGKVMRRLALLVFGALLMAGGIAGLTRPNYLEALDREGVNVTATITKFEWRKSYGSRTARVMRDAKVEPVVHYSFRTAANETIRWSKTLRPEQYERLRGQSNTTVRYLPSLPRVHELVVFSLRRRPGKDNAFDFIMFWSAMFLVGAAVSYWAWPKRRRKETADEASIVDTPFARTVTANATKPTGFGKRQN